MKILLADKFPEAYLEQLQANHSCTYQPDLTAEELPNVIADFDALVVRSTKVEAATINAATALKLIVRAGSGTNTIDKQTAADKNIAVCNTPARNAIAVAELAMGLLLAVDRHIASADRDSKQQQWNKGRYSKATGLFGRHVGIVGFGAIGQAFAERAAAFGMKLHTVNRPESQAFQSSAKSFELTLHDNIESLASAVDIISFHVPLNDSTKNMINADLLSHVQDNTVILNTSRGELVDEDAFIKALVDKNLYAGLDVFQNEPKSSSAEFSSTLAQHPQVVATHHIGASTTQAQLSVAEAVVDIITAFEGGEVLNRVN